VLDYLARPRAAVGLFAASALGLVAVVTVAYRALFGDGGACLENAIQLQLSALDQAPLDRFTYECNPQSVRDALWPDIGLAAIYMAGLGLFLTVWWRRSWDVRESENTAAGRAFSWIAAAAFACTVIANLLTASRLDISTRQYVLGPAATVATFGWVRWLLTGLLVAAFVATVVSWMIRAVAQVYRALFDQAEAEAYVPDAVAWSPDDDPRPRFAVSLSGGGIRSAAFSLGALSALEETPVGVPAPGSSAGLLGQADMISSVSGGGYAASAWRIAVGTKPDYRTAEPVIGNPNDCAADAQIQTAADDDDDQAMRRKLFPRILDRRRYLAQGRGGLVVTAAWTVAQLVWHFGLLLLLVGLIAWPVGRMVRSPIITSDGGSVQFGLLAGPGLLVLMTAGVVLVLRSFTQPGKWRTGFDLALLALLALSGGLFTVLVVLPWLTTVLIPELSELLPGGAGAQSTVATVLTGGVVATVWRVIQAPLKTYAAYLGGALLAIGLILFGGLISLHAASDDRFFTGSWRAWLVTAGVYAVVMVAINPDLWSMHPVYCRKLAATFANRWTGSEWEEMGRSADHPPLSAYAEAPGPKPLICAVAARMDRANTGVPVVSLTFQPDRVTVHPGPDSDSMAIETAAYEATFGGRIRAGWMQSVIGLAAMSAAAVAPSLGRMSLGSTNALIAALNLRLGVWMPNPLYDRGRRAGPDMSAMFKEMVGHFGLDDPNLYVTDGGHWENLGLVELVRRRTAIIIAVDASADPPYSFKALGEAVELALLECGAKINFEPGEIEAMKPGDGPRPARNWATATVTFDDKSTGRLLYVKAQASSALPLDILRYSKEDPDFPNYSTANQFLGEAEFTNLAILGRESMIRALEDKSGWLFAPVERPDIDLTDEPEPPIYDPRRQAVDAMRDAEEARRMAASGASARARHTQRAKAEEKRAAREAKRAETRAKAEAARAAAEEAAAEMTEAEPVDMAAAEPVEMAEAEPVDMAEAEPVDMAAADEPQAPVEMATAEPVDMAAAEPVEMAAADEPQAPVDMAAAEPVEMAAADEPDELVYEQIVVEAPPAAREAPTAPELSS
jgi:hypothetical protein